MNVRPATQADVPAMVELSSRERARAETFEPVFWRRSADADERQTPWFAGLVADGSIGTFVSGPSECPTGYIIALLVDAPPVYAPGGKTCLIDDYEYATGDEGRQLREAVEAWAVRRGAIQTIVVAPFREEGRRELLIEGGFHVVSEWWLRPLV